MEIRPPLPFVGELVLADLQATELLGQRLVKHVPVGSVIALCGTLGAGKTRLVQAMARAIHQSNSATSPTFTLMHRYEGNPPINHLDAYRIRDLDEMLEVGIEEICDDATAITIIEWANRFAEVIPDEGLWIVLELEDTHRRAKFFGHLNRWQTRLVPLIKSD